MPSAKDASVSPGDILAGKYRVLRFLGRGGMGAVVEALNVPLGERVAIKVLHDRYVDNAEAMARFHHEARAAVRIRGEHAVRLLDVGETPTGAPFIAMELLEGMDLATRLRQGPIPIEDAVLYILEACVGMAEVHANGIIHRDLKPGNLFLTHRADASPLVKVLDFGIAKSLAPDGDAHVTMTLVALGTPLYMSPEQVRSSKSVDGRSDVWSLGAILFELIAGIPAFGGNTVSNITAQILEGSPPNLTLLREGVPAKLDKIVHTALAKKPDQRYADVAAFAAALAPFAAGDEGHVLAERAARTVRGDGRALQNPGSISAVTSVAPAALVDNEVAVTHRWVRVRSRGVLGLALAGIALVIIGASVGAVQMTGDASQELAAKGISEHAAVSVALVRSAVKSAALAGSPTSTPRVDLPLSTPVSTSMPLEPSELPDARGLDRGARAVAPQAVPPTPRKVQRSADDDPLSSRR